MTLIKSISGIRGTIGGKPGEGLSPLDLVKFVSAYSDWIQDASRKKKPVVVLGRDARLSGALVSNIVSGTLCGYGIDVLDLGLATTPTVELAVTEYKADGGIILTASHNPAEWNALKLLNGKGEFISAEEGSYILQLAHKENFNYATIDNIGNVTTVNDCDDMHIEMILNLPLVNRDAISSAGFSVAIDSVNSVGGIILPKLLEKLGVNKVIEINSDPTGVFSHNPEPLPENLFDLVSVVKNSDADVGFVVDPDVDRLAIISEDGSFFNEEYTLVACSDYVLSHTPGNTVSNMSSSRALRDVTNEYGMEWFSSAVGEVNVVKKMKEVGAIIGGEGNGGIIYPELHYGRDALVGIALFLSHLALSKLKCSELRAKYPEYVISKNRIDLPANTNPDPIISALVEKYSESISSREDGILIETDEGWIQVRKSNTEAIIRVYSEASNRELADNLASEIIKSVKIILKS